jgi:SAM-dependent methyltransferase
MIVTWSRGDPSQNMPEEILADLGPIIRRHPWWQARARLTLALLEQQGIRPPATILDVGCGWGVTLDHLERRGYRVTGLDIARRALELLDRPDRTLIEADLTQPLPPDAGGFDAVLALDVIEHLDDDRAAVGQLARLVRPGGLVLVSVPALPELFSEFDSIQGHRRRYLPETLQRAFEGSGLDLARTLWWGGWMVPVLRRQRRDRASAGVTTTDIYRRYLRLPRWPGTPMIRLAYRLDQPRTLAARPRKGTTLIALARCRPSWSGR